MLESYTQTVNKTIHIMEIPSRYHPDRVPDIEFVVGRSSYTDVRITDISVSRTHSLITYHKGNFYVKDLDSKFGTVTRLRHPISIQNRKNQNVMFQIGKTLLEVSNQGMSLGSICNCCKSSRPKIAPARKPFFGLIRVINNNFTCFSTKHYL